MKMSLLGDVCNVIMGQSPPSSTYNNKGRGLPFFQGKVDFGDSFRRHVFIAISLRGSP